MPGPIMKPHVYIYESEYRMIYSAAREFINDETGGDLYGTFTHGDMPIIWLASGPGPRVRRNRVHFEQDTSFTTGWQRQLMNQFGVQYIGSWHSHHSLGLREPSSGDREAARIYALNHNRSRTLEIIVTHEENNETSLWFYFYSDAVRGSLLRAERVFLPGVSPLRTQLDANAELEFSGGTNWKRGRLPNASQSGNLSSPVATQTSSEQQVDIPVELNEELETISSYLEDVTIGNTVVVRLTVKEGLALDISIDMASRMLLQVDLLNKAMRTRQDITPYVRRQPFSLSIRPKSRVLHHTFQAFPAIYQQLATDAKQAELKNQVELEHLSSLTNEPPLKNPIAASAEDNQQVQQIRLSGVESALKPKLVNDVSIYSEKIQSDHYDMTIKIRNKSITDQIHAILLQLSIPEEQIQIREGANNTLTIVLTVAEVKHVKIMLNALCNAFEYAKLDFDAGTQHDLQQIVLPQEENGKTKGFMRIWHFLNPFDDMEV